MIEISPNPIFLTLGNFKLSCYALVYLAAFITITIILLKSRQKLNLTEKEIYNFLFFSIFSTIVGARLFHILFWNFQYFIQNPIKIFQIWQGGMSFHGGLLGAILAGIIYTKIKKISFYKIADIIVIPAAFFLALGRIANFLNAEILGKPSNLKWCVKFPNVAECTHPIQIYAAAGRLALFAYLALLKKTKPGFIFWNFITLISAGRFILDFLRQDVLYFNLTIGQWLSIPMFLVGVFVLIKNYR